MNLYRNEASNPKWNAQRNLQGRTHYVDDETLRWHKARILSARATHGGLFFAIVESVALDMNNARRGCRYAIFDLFGTVLDRPDLEHCHKRSEQATKAMWDAINKLDGRAVTLAAIERAELEHEREMGRLRDEVVKLSEEGKS